MGSGSYSQEAYERYVVENNVSATNARQNFRNTRISNKTSVAKFSNKGRKQNTDIQEAGKAIGVREFRESEEHPVITPIIPCLDVTGSMRKTPQKMLTDQFPKIMNALDDAGVPGPQLMFMAIGDCYYDDYPIQATQAESDPQKLLPQLQEFVLEGGGGCNPGESYSLAHIVAGWHTETDPYYKRGDKGFLITIGDEPNLPEVPGNALEKYLGYQRGAKTITAEEALAKAREQYDVHHIHINDGSNRFDPSWYDFLGKDHVWRCNSDDVAKTIVKIVTSNLKSTAQQPSSVQDVVDTEPEDKHFGIDV